MSGQDVLTVAESGLSTDFANIHAVRWLRSLIDPVVAAALSQVYFECRLGLDACVDLGIVLRRDADAEIVCRNLLRPRIGGRSEVMWKSVVEFVERWLLGVTCPWLDRLFVGLNAVPDAASGTVWNAEPHVYVPLIGRYGSRPRDSHEIASALGEIRQRMVPRDEIALLERCLEAMPDGSDLFGVGQMFFRDEASHRLCISRLPLEGVSQFLQQVGWLGERHILDSLIHELNEIDSRHFDLLHLDIGKTYGQRIGLEFAVDDSNQIQEEHASSPLVSYLLERDLCLPAKWSAAEAWPRRVVVGANPSGEDIVRKVNSIKVSVAGGGDVSTKIYLWSRRARTMPRH